MKEGPEKYWDNIPREIDSSDGDEADAPVARTAAKREAEQKDAEHYSD